MSKSNKVSKTNNLPQAKFDTAVVSKDCCCICTGIPTLPILLPDCGHSFCYTCIKGYKLANPQPLVCPLCRTPVTIDIDHIKVDNVDKAIERYIDKPYWIYQTNDFKSWLIY